MQLKLCMALKLTSLLPQQQQMMFAKLICFSAATTTGKEQNRMRLGARLPQFERKKIKEEERETQRGCDNRSKHRKLFFFALHCLHFVFVFWWREGWGGVQWGKLRDWQRRRRERNVVSGGRQARSNAITHTHTERRQTHTHAHTLSTCT